MAEYEVTAVRWQMGEELTLEERTQKAEDFIKSFLKPGTPIILAAEPDNPKHDDAIAVYRKYTKRVGYIKRESCKEVKPLLNSFGQRDAVVSGNDGHVTFYVEIPDAPETVAPPVEDERKLPECPLPPGLGLHFSDEERGLQVVATQLVNLTVSADTVDTLLEMAEQYMPLSRLSLCREDDYWRDHVLKQLRKACRLKLNQPEKERLEQLCDELHQTVGDFHRAHENWQQKLFDHQLELLRQQAEGEFGLYENYEKCGSCQADIIGSIVRWFEGMPHLELRDYENHDCLARRLSYIGVSRQELYEVYAAILLLNKYGGERMAHADGKPKATKPKAKPARKPSGKPMTLKYYTHGNNGVLRNQRKRVDIVFRKFNEWGWIDDQTTANDFDAFFEGSPKHCNITWKANSTILTILLQELLKQPYIEKQKRCAAKSLVEQQFGMTANSDRTRLDTIAEERIQFTLYILDSNKELPERRGREYAEDVDIKDAALREVIVGNLRSTKGI